MKILRVFTNEDNNFGNPLGIVIDEENSLDKKERQQITIKSGFSEVVFINNINKRNISIYSPQGEIPFAGHAAVGTTYFLTQEYRIPVTRLIGVKDVVETWQKNGLTWVKGKLSITPPWNYEQLPTTSSIKNISLEQTLSKKHTVVWAWLDESKGIIQARTFASDWGIPEDEANGSGSMKLAAKLNRDLIIHHGKGSVIYARPLEFDFAAVGGRVNF